MRKFELEVDADTDVVDGVPDEVLQDELEKLYAVADRVRNVLTLEHEGEEQIGHVFNTLETIDLLTFLKAVKTYKLLAQLVVQELEFRDGDGSVQRLFEQVGRESYERLQKAKAETVTA